MFLRSVKALVCCLVLFIPYPIYGASIEDLELTKDGSQRPPGDLLEMTVKFKETDLRRISVQVRAYRVEGEEREVQIPVEAKGEDNRDKDGNFLLTVQLWEKIGGRVPRIRRFRPGESKATSAPIMIRIPYSDSKLPKGTHEVGYVVTVVKGEDPPVDYPLRLTQFTITDKTRKWVEIEIELTRKASETEKRPVVVIGEDGKPREEVYEETVEKEEVFSRENREYSTNIPGEYIREEIEGADEPRGSEAKVVTIDGVDAIAALREDVEKKPWVPKHKRLTYYATNRNVEDASEKSAKRFGYKPSETISYGTTLVNIPLEKHERGKLELGKKTLWWKAKDPKKYFELYGMTVIARDTFLQGMVHNMAEYEQDILVFVHGYNNTFEFATLRLAQMVHDIKFPGRPMLFSWPSAGKKSHYSEDQGRADKSVSKLGTVLIDLIKKRRALGSIGKIHVLAHSMGSRVFMKAIHYIRNVISSDPSDPKPFGHIVLAAPDIELRTFLAFHPTAVQAAEDVTHYFCHEDLALKLSVVANNGRSRLGQGPAFLDGVLNIDAAKANTSFIGHAYYASKSVLLIDLNLLLNKDQPPPRRPTITETSRWDKVFWFFP